MLFRHTSEGYKEQDAQFVRLIRQMYTSYAEKRYGYELEVLSDYYRMLHCLVTQYRERDVDEERLKRHRRMKKLYQITSYIQEHYKEDMTLERVAGIEPALSGRKHDILPLNYSRKLSNIFYLITLLYNNKFVIASILLKNYFSIFGT